MEMRMMAIRLESVDEVLYDIFYKWVLHQANALIHNPCNDDIHGLCSHIRRIQEKMPWVKSLFLLRIELFFELWIFRGSVFYIQRCTNISSI